MSTNNYFEEIGMWSESIARLFWMYLSGFVLSLIITLTAYLIVVNHVWTQVSLTTVLLLLALLQFVVQMMCFLHLSTKRHSRERLIVLVCAMVIISTIVIGSIWIMANLNARMTSDPTQMDQYMNSQSGL